MGPDADRGGPELLLTAEEGMLAGEVLAIPLGATVVVGRSRSCDFSTRRSRRFVRASEQEQFAFLDDPDFLRISRRHVRIRFLSEDQVEIQDLSRNGTYVNGERIGRRIYPRPDGRGIKIRMAKTEVFRLS